MSVFLQGSLPAVGFETLTIADTALPLTASAYQAKIGAGGSAESNRYDRRTAQRATITVETAAIRVRFDGTDPTSDVGHLFNTGQSIDLNTSGQIQSFRAIRQGGSSAVLQITYWGA